MRVEIHFRDKLVAVASVRDGKVVLDGAQAEAAAEVVDHYRNFAEGDALLDLLLQRLHGHWWAKAAAGDLPRKGG